MEASSMEPLDRFASYPFATDAGYQQGLSVVLSGGAFEEKSDEEKAELLLRSEVFYFNRVTRLSIDIAEARMVRANATSQAETNAAQDRSATTQEPPTLTFAQLKELIEQGRTDEIPNNKKIPDILSTDTPSESKASVRKKPWE